MEECVLSGVFAHQILYVIDYQYVDALVEVDEIVDFATLDSRGVLALKQSGCDIEHSGLRVLLLDAYAYGLDEVGLAYACRAEYEEGVESLELRIHRYGLADGVGHTVTRTRAIIFEGVARIELRVYVGKLLGLEGAYRYRRCLAEAYGRVGIFAAHGHPGLGLVADLVVVVEQLDFGTIHLDKGSLEDTEESFLYLLDKERRGHIDCESVVDVAHRCHGAKPGVKLFRGKIVLEYLETSFPEFGVFRWFHWIGL